MEILTVRVAGKIRETDDIATYELVSADGRPLPAFEAGAHLDVHVSENLVRQYSLCNAPGEQQRYLITVLRDANSRGGSAAMHAQIKEGDLLRVSLPKNHFPLVPAAPALLFAGGIGITPLLAMAETLSATGTDFSLHYCTRSRAHTAFIDRIARAPYASRVQFHHDDGAGEQKLDVASVLGAAAGDTHLYVCGPAGFIDHVIGAATQCGWTAERIHREYFGAAPAGNAVAGDAGGAFTVRIASTGQVIPIAAEKSVYQALAEAGIEIPVSCEQGVCGTCLTRVLEGVPDHHDLYLTDEEHAANDQFTPCCSRAKSALLVLDL